MTQASPKNSSLLMGVVADDVTGSNDIGIMFAKNGCLTHVHTYEDPQAPSLLPADGSPNGPLPDIAMPDIAILNTNSRLDPPDLAYAKVYAATRRFLETGSPRFFNKTCSVFRGNIGPEFDAMLDALAPAIPPFAVVVLGFPKNGRLTIDGIHYVHGRKLEESEFRNDPIHPMTRSNLVDILASQTRRTVNLIDHTVVDRGPQALQRAIDAQRGAASYVILDVTGQEALRTIAEAVADEPVLCGSSALAEELPAAWGVKREPAGSLDLPGRDGLGILVVAGSLMPQTAAQLAHLKSQGVAASELDVLRLFDPQGRQLEAGRLAVEAAAHLLAGQDALIHSPNDPAAVQAARDAGRRYGFSPTETARLVSETLAEAAAGALARSGQNRLAVAGGETSAAVCTRLGVKGMRVWREIQPGLPSCLSLDQPPYLLVLKSGSFGTPAFLEEALAHLREQ